MPRQTRALAVEAAAEGGEDIDPELPWPPEVMNVPDVARYLRFSEQHTRRMAEEGKIPGWKIGTSWRFSRAAIDELLTGRRAPS